MKMKKYSIVALLLLAAANAYGDISWETTQITQTADPLSESVSATFKFKNVGDFVITIKEIKPGCGCTTATLEKKTYAPGESGEITATLTIGNRQGLQSKAIRVTTDGGEAPTVLTMKTLIPEILGIQPTFVFWQKGEAPAVKTINLNVGIDEMHIIKAQSDNNNMTVQLDEIEPGKRYRISLFPASTNDLLKARITLVTDYPKNKPKIFYVFAHVK